MKIALILVVGLIIVAFGFIYFQNSKSPDLGVTEGTLKPLSGKPNGVSTQTTDPSKKVSPLPFKENAENTLQALATAVSQYGNAKVIEQEDDYLYVVFTTTLMKFRDDAEFYLDANSRQVHFRSASRAGYSDMGLNAKRYQKLAEIYNTL